MVVVCGACPEQARRKGGLAQTSDGISGQASSIREGVSEVRGQITVVRGRDEFTTGDEGPLWRGAGGLSAQGKTLEQALEHPVR
ncbi:MAG TPA: hypothetical protein VGI23_06155 [Steroidobacteraceae bacterium]